jgi:alpha-galactosidase
MRSLVAVLIVSLLCPVLARGATTWKLATADTAVEIGVAEHRPVVLHLGAVGDAHDWLENPASLATIDRVGIAARETPLHWRFQSGGVDAKAGTLTLVFANAEPALLLRSIWRARPGRGPVEHWLQIENRSSDVLTIGHQDSLTLQGLRPRGAAELWWIQRGGGNASTQGGTFHKPLAAGQELVLASNCEDGASPVPWLAVQVGSSRGLYVGWQFSGLGRIRASSCADRLGLEIGNRPEFKTDLPPGETFLVPPAMIGCYRGDLDEGSYALHRFVLEKLRPPLPKECPDPILAYNLYLDAGGDQARQSDVLRSAKFCGDLGFEAFMPDAMWFPEAGDWRWDPRRFPQGIAPIEQYVHASGMKLALWGASSVRGPQGRPERFNADYPADWKPGPFYGAQLCLGCPEAKRWAMEKTQWLVGHHRLDYLKHDCGPIVNTCNKMGHRHRYGVDASYWATMGYYEVQEQLRRKFPNLILENCSGGGHIKDFGVIRRTHYTVATDTLSNLPDRQAMFDSTYALPPLVLQAYTYDNVYPVPGDKPGNFLWRSGMMGAWQIDPTDTLLWTAEETQSARRSVQIYKEWIRPLLADVKVHHILPRPDGVHWDGMFQWSPGRRRGTLFIFRPGSPESEKTVRLKGLDAAGRYWIWCEDGSITPGERTGSELMDRGIKLRLPAEYASDLVFLQDAALGKPRGLDLPGEFRLKQAEVRADMFSISARFAWEPAPAAHAYRLTVVDPAQSGKVVAAMATSLPAASIDALPPGRPLRWRVEAISWGGTRSNAGEPGHLTTPSLDRREGIVFLSDIPWSRATAGANNPVRRNVNYYGKRITIAGKAYPKGLWTHTFNDSTPADIVFPLHDGKYAWFKADVGLEDAAGSGSVEFQVLVDAKVAASSPVQRPRQVHKFHVPLRGAKQITLRVLNGGDGYSCDHSAWGFARFVEPEVKDPLDHDAR